MKTKLHRTFVISNNEFLEMPEVFDKFQGYWKFKVHY